MGLPRRCRLRRSERVESGAAAVEAALTLPLLVLLVFGLIEYAMVMDDSIAITDAARSGVRTAAARAKYADFATTTVRTVAAAMTVLDSSSIKEMWIYKAASNGKPLGDTGSFASCSQCYRYTWDPASRAFILSGTATWTPAQQNACPDTADSVGVWVHVEHRAVTTMFFTTLTLSDYAVMQLEPRAKTSCGSTP